MKSYQVFPVSRLILCLITIASFGSAFGGGPRFVASDHTPVRWNPARVAYVIDAGKLGSRSQEDAAGLVRGAFSTWENVDTASITFEDKGFLPVDVNVTNYEQYIDVKRPEGNVVIFDDDGEITEDVFGIGSSSIILGFAAAVPQGKTFSYAFAVLNGPNSTDSLFAPTIVHELGHLIGLDHTQAGSEFAGTSNSQSVPVMYPILQFFPTRVLLRDDIAWVSWLYPTAEFAATTGTITGKVFRANGSPLLGANVVAVLVQDQAESRNERVSVVSDFLTNGDGSFEIPGLKPGNYQVFIEPIDPAFTVGSRVGPYEQRFASFVKDYYNEPGEGSEEDPLLKNLVPVQVTATTPNINITANEFSNRLDLLTDDGEMLFRFPPDFTFPFFGTRYTEVFVNSDGNLTFGAGDGVPGEARSEARFLSGPPRIAPLFTDLDPGAAGEIRASVSPGQVTFTWDRVPEFSDTTFPTRNLFSVTLFASGDIRFVYDRVAITPDEDLAFPQGLQVIVGITPGGGAASTQKDLSSIAPTIPVQEAPIHEVFNGSTFDLEGEEIFFVAGTTEIFFPFYRGNLQEFSGFGVTNLDTRDALLEFSARGADGALLPSPSNPHAETLPPQHQLAKLGQELLGVAAGTEQLGWMRLSSNTPNLASFFQIGNGLSGPVTRMDGSTAVLGQAKVLYFSRVYEGDAVVDSLSGRLPARTLLSVANPNATDITVQFTLYAPTGQPAAGDVSRTIAAGGVLQASLHQLFNTTSPVLDGFVRAEVTSGDGAVGFELIELSDTLLGFNATVPGSATVLYSAQLANGTSDGGTIFTSLKVVNTSSSPRSLTISGFGDQGNPIGQVVTFSLAPNQTFQKDVGELFGIGAVTDAQTVGSMTVEADGAGVIGDVVFGDPTRLEFAAALPLQASPFRRAVFSQVANGQLNPADPSTDTFTGIALFNPGTQSSDISVNVFDRDGNQVGATFTDTLAPHQRLSRLIEDLVPQSGSLIRGFITLKASQPIVAQELFGNNVLKFLSAVPPTVVE